MGLAEAQKKGWDWKLKMEGSHTHILHACDYIHVHVHHEVYLPISMSCVGEDGWEWHGSLGTASGNLIP